jgi:hypothetical protein
MLYKSFDLDNYITKIFFKNDLFIGSDNILKMNIGTMEILQIYKTDDLSNPSALFVNDSYIFAGYDSGFILQIDVSTGKIINKFNHHKDKIYNIFVTNNTLFSNSADNKLIIFDIINNKKIKILNSNNQLECNFIVSNNILYYTGESENIIIQYDYINDKIIQKFEDKSPILYIFLHDSFLLISTSDENIKSWDTKRNTTINIINLEAKFDFIHLDNNNNLYLANTYNTDVIKVNINEEDSDNLQNEIIFNLPGNISGVIPNVFNQYLIISSNDGTIHVYENEEIKEEEEDTQTFKNFSSNKSSLKTNDYYKNINCTNYNVFTLENYTSDDDPIQIYTLNNQNIFEISNCITIDELTHHLNSGKDTIHPSMLMSICTPRSNATGKIVISLPPNNLFYTYGSIEKIFLNKQNKNWFALPLFGGKRRRIGNLDEAPLIGSLHCQIPGYKVYKLYTQDEINKNIEVKETLSDYPSFLYNNLTQLFELGNTNITKNFINNLIDNLFK